MLSDYLLSLTDDDALLVEKQHYRLQHATAYFLRLPGDATRAAWMWGCSAAEANALHGHSHAIVYEEYGDDFEYFVAYTLIDPAQDPYEFWAMSNGEVTCFPT